MPVNNESHESTWIQASMILLWVVMLAVTGSPKVATGLSTFFLWRSGRAETSMAWSSSVWSFFKREMKQRALSSIYIRRDKDPNPAPITNGKASKTGVKLGKELMHIGDDACMPAAVYLWPPSADNPGASGPGTRSSSTFSSTACT